FVQRHDLAERHTVLGLFNRFKTTTNGGTGQHHSPASNSPRNGGLGFRDEIVFQRTMDAKMRFRVNRAGQNIVSFGIDSLFRRKTAEIGSDRSDLLSFDANARRYDIWRNNQFSIIDH